MSHSCLIPLSLCPSYESYVPPVFQALIAYSHALEWDEASPISRETLRLLSSCQTCQLEFFDERCGQHGLWDFLDLFKALV